MREKVWVDVNGCREDMHIFALVDDELVITHSDDTPCEQIEHSITKDMMGAADA
jgi:hypothetical protein